jgi:hypothetical protein
LECLEDRFLMSAAPLLGALESAVVGPLASITSLTALVQPATDANSDPTSSQPTGGSGTADLGAAQADASHQDGNWSQWYSSGASLDLGGLVSLNLGGNGSTAQGSTAQSSAAGSSNAQSSEQNGSSSLLQISLGALTGAASLGSASSQDGSSQDSLGIRVDLNPSGDPESPAGGLLPGIQPGAMLAALMNARLDPDGDMGDGFSEAMAPAGSAANLGGYVSVNASRPMPTLDNSRPALAFSQIAQTLGQTAARDARQSDDPHLSDPSAAVTADRDLEGGNTVHQANMPAPVVTTAQVPLNSASGANSPTVTDGPEAQLSLVSRVAAAVMPAALRLASGGVLGSATESDAEPVGDSDVPATVDPAADDADTAHDLPQAAASLIPSSLLAIVPGDLHAVDQALEQLLDELDELGGGLVGYAASSVTVQWASAGVGLAACLGGVYFQRGRRRANGGSANDEALEEDTANWMFSRMQSLAAGCD